MLGHSEMKYVRRLVAARGEIDMSCGSDAYQVFPNGDRRKRRASFWIQKTMVSRLLSEDALRYNGKGYVVTTSLARRIERTPSNAKHSETAGQHYDLEERDVYIPGGSLRKARVNRRVNALEVLARKRRSDGQLVLSAAEIEAGRRLAADYHLAGAGQCTTQNYDSPLVDGSRKSDAAENAILARMTARTRLTAARAAMGEGLDGPVIAICCREESISSVERAERWAKSSGLSILKIGLSRLVKLYGTETGSRATYIRPSDRPGA